MHLLNLSLKYPFYLKLAFWDGDSNSYSITSLPTKCKEILIWQFNKFLKEGYTEGQIHALNTEATYIALINNTNTNIDSLIKDAIKILNIFENEAGLNLTSLKYKKEIESASIYYLKGNKQWLSNHITLSLYINLLCLAEVASKIEYIRDIDKVSLSRNLILLPLKHFKILKKYLVHLCTAFNQLTNIKNDYSIHSAINYGIITYLIKKET